MQNRSASHKLNGRNYIVRRIRQGGQTVGEVPKSEAGAIYVFFWGSSWKTNDDRETEADNVGQHSGSEGAAQVPRRRLNQKQEMRKYRALE